MECLDVNHIGDIIRIYRERRGMYLYQLAHKAGVSDSALSRIELGQVVPSEDLLAVIAGVLSAPEILLEKCRGCAVGRELARLKAA